MKWSFREWVEQKLASMAVGGKIANRIADMALLRVLLYSFWFRAVFLVLVMQFIRAVMKAGRQWTQ